MTAPLSKGTPVEKINSKPGKDRHPDGARATVVACLKLPDSEEEYGYFVEWDDLPGLPVFVSGSRIKRRDTA